MNFTIPITKSIFRFVVSFNYQYDFLPEQVSKSYFYCNHLVYQNFEPYYYQGYGVMLYKPLPFEDSIDNNGYVIFKAYDSIFERVYCNEIIERFYKYRIVYPKSALGDYWGIKSTYFIEDYDDYHYIPSSRKSS